MKEKKNNARKELSEAENTRAANEVNAAIQAMFPDDQDYQHEFSPKFEAKMAQVIEEARAAERNR